MANQQQSVREILLRIAGEVSPSAKSAMEEIISIAEKIGRASKMSAEEIDESMIDAIKQTVLLAEVWKRYQEEVSNAESVQDKTKKSMSDLTEEEKKQQEATEKSTKETQRAKSGLEKLINALGLTKTQAAALATGIGLLTKGFLGLQESVATIRGYLVSAFTGITNTIKNIVSEGVGSLKDVSKAAMEINSTFEQAELSMTAMTRSEEGAATLMRILRQEAVRTGRVTSEIAEIGWRLVPYSEGDVAKFKELLNLTLRLSAMRPELPLNIATRALMEFQSGYTQTLNRTFGISRTLINNVTAEMGYTVEAFDTIMTKFRVGEDLVADFADTWLGLTNTLRDFGQRIIRDLGGPMFDLLKERLGALVGWLRDNTEQIRSFSIHIGRNIRDAFQKISDSIFGTEGFSPDKLFEVAEWGANLLGSLTEGILRGINTFLIPALVKVTEIIAAFLKGASPPKMGILRTIDKWFGPVLRAYLSGFNASDFTALNDIGNIIRASLKTAVATGEISQDEMNTRLLESRGILVNLVQEFRTLGSVSQSVWSQIGNLVGMDTGLIKGYLELTQRLEAAQHALAAAEAAYAAAQAKVRDIQKEIQLFELQTAEIPERYKRGRRRELEYKLMVAQEEARLRQEAVKAAREQVQQAREMLNAYKQMVSWLEKLAEEAAKIAKEGEDKDIFGFDALVGVGDQLAELEGQFKHLYDTIQNSFKGAREQLEYLSDFMKGLFGKRPTQVEGFQLITPGYEAGMEARQTLQIIHNNLWKIGDVIERIGDKIEEIIIWYNTKAPDWLKKMLKIGAITVAINWATGGLLSSLLTILAGAGIILGTVGGGAIGGAAASAILPIAIVFTLLGGAYALGEVISKAAEKAGLDIPSPHEFIQSIQLKMEAGDAFFDALDATLDEMGQRIMATIAQIANRIKAEHPILASLLFSISRIGLAGPEELGGIVNREFVNIMSQIKLPGITRDAINVAGDLIGGIIDTFSGKKDDISEATNEGIVSPILAMFREMEDEAVGHSIFPDMIENIVELFTRLPSKLISPLLTLINTIKYYGESAALWWRRSITMMRNDIRRLISDLNSAIRALQRYYQVASNQIRTEVTTQIDNGNTGIQEFQTGGLIKRLQLGLLHPGEVVLNVAQQRNVAYALAGAKQPTGFGAGAMHIEINQTGWSFQGTPNIAEVRRIAKEGAYEGIAEVFTRARDVGG